MSVISSRSEYLFVDPVDLPEEAPSGQNVPRKIRYGGDIMPLRPVDDMTLRGIDPLFLVNKTNMMWSLLYGSKVTTGVRFFKRIDSRNMSRVRDGMRSFAGSGEYYRRGGYGLCGNPGYGIYEVTVNGNDWFSEIPDATVNIQWQCPTSAFVTGGPLVKLEVEKLFHDCDKRHLACSTGFLTSRFEHSTSTASHSWTADEYSHDPGPTITPGQDWIYYYDARSTWNDEHHAFNSFHELEDAATSADVRFKVNDRDATGELEIPPAAYPSHVTNCILAEARYNYSKGDEPGTFVTKQYALVTNTVKDGQNYGTNFSSLSNLIRRVKQDVGFEKLDLHSDLGETLHLEVEMIGMAAVMRIPDGYSWD